MRRFMDLLFPPRADEAIVRELEPDALVRHLAPRVVPVCEPGAIVLLPYEEQQVRAALHEAKYHGSPKAFALLARAACSYLAVADVPVSETRLVPVPLGAQRRKERGFNQAEEVAQRMSEHLGVRLSSNLLLRTRETVSQVTLPRHHRRDNMLGAFQARGKIDPAYLYIVLDDVATTGATLQAAIDALRIAGATRIYPLALAH